MKRKITMITSILLICIIDKGGIIMKKTNIILVIIIIILLIALAIMTKLYLDMRKSSKLGLESTLENANLLFEANKEIDILEKELESYKNANITTTITNTVANTVNNTSNTNTTEPYIPEGMKVADINDNSGIKASDIVFNTKAENVTIEILKDTITNTSVEILITDNNEDQYGWGKSYRIQNKENRSTNKSRSTSGLAWTAFSRGFICPFFSLVSFLRRALVSASEASRLV